MRFFRFAAVALLALGGLVLLWRWSALHRAAPPGRITAAPPAAESRSPSAPAARDARQSPDAARRVESLERFAYAQGWTRSMPPPLEAFREWTARFVRASASERLSLEAEGLALARSRRPVMRDLIMVDPQRALALTVPAAVRQVLPASVLAELESRVSGRGEFSLVFATPAPGEPAPPPIRRIAGIGGATYTAHVYGRREPQLSLAETSLHGIALDHQLALHESPLRVLEPGEVLVSAAAAACPVTDESIEPEVAGAAANLAELAVVEADGRIWEFCAGTPEMLDAFAHALEQRENDAGIGGTVTPERAADAATAWTTGTKRVLVIRADFPDVPGEPITLITGQNVMGPVKTFLEDMSYGLTSIDATVTPQVYRLPQTASAYATAGNDSGLHSDARTAARADYDVSSYDRIIVVFPNIGSSRFSNSRITFGGQGSINGANIWINGNGSFALPTVTHELGHTYGLPHSNLWRVNDGNPLSSSGVSLEYGDPFCVMGSSSVTGVSRDTRHHLNPWHKNRLGWLPDEAVTRVTASGRYRVYRFDSKTSPRTQPLALQIYRDGVRSYWVGLRQNFSIGSPQANDAHVIWGFNMRQQTALLDLTTPGDGATDASLPLNSTFADAEYGITIKPVARGGTAPNEYLDIDVTVPSVAPPHVVSAWGRDGAYFFTSGSSPGATTPRPETNVPMGLTGVRAIAAGDQHVLALKSDGTVVAWGDHGAGQTNVPAGLGGVIAIAGGGDVSAAVKADGTVVLWGDNESGQLNVPPDLTGVRQVAIGRNHVLALRSDGTVVAWGGNNVGQTNVPPNLRNVVAVTAGTHTSVALRSDGTIVGWGDSRATPPAGLSNVIAISARGVLTGGQFVAALRADGTVAAWGANNVGQINVPAGLDHVVAISAGAFHTLCLKADGTVVAFGNTTGGKLNVPPNLPRSYAVVASAQGSFALTGPNVYVTRQPADIVAEAGGPAILSVGATGSGSVTYQWRKDGVAVPGATASTLTIANVSAGDAGSYDVIVRDATSVMTSFPARLSVAVGSSEHVSRISNLSILTSLASRTDSFRMGFVVGGAGTSGPKRLVIRAVGPSLGTLGVTGTLGDPRIELFSGNARVAENDDWEGVASVASAMAAVGAFPFADARSLDAALVADVTARDNSVVVGSAFGGAPSGQVIAEIYDATPAPTFSARVPRLINVSVLKNLGTGLTAGFVIAGPPGSSKRVVVRAVGPGLAAVGVNSGYVPDPRLVLHGPGVELARNDDWAGGAELTAAFAAVGAFALPPTSRDAAIVATLPAGDYSVAVAGDDPGGLVLVEVYEVP